MTQNATATPDQLTDAQIEDYLRRHPTFFLEHETLLTELYLPHASGEAVSLLERQVSLLRERNIDARKRLKDFLEEGERNDELFGKTRELVLTLMDARSLSHMVESLYAACQTLFGLEHQQFTLIDPPAALKPALVRALSRSEAEQKMPSVARISQCAAGVFRDEELKLLFAGDHADVKSALVLPIFAQDELVALMAFGSDDARYFCSNMDTLFLDFIGDVLGRLLPRFLKSLG